MNNRRSLPSIKKMLHYTALLILAGVFILPFLWMISTSLKGYENIFSLPLKWLPEKIHWENYLKVFQAMPFLVYLKNSVFVTVLAITGTVLSASVVAYSFAVLRWPGRDTLFIVVIATMMLPAQVTMIPLFVRSMASKPFKILKENRELFETFSKIMKKEEVTNKEAINTLHELGLLHKGKLTIMGNIIKARILQTTTKSD